MVRMLGRLEIKDTRSHTAKQIRGTQNVLAEVLELMARRCFVHNNQQSAVKGYLAAKKTFTRFTRVGSCRTRTVWSWL